MVNPHSIIIESIILMITFGAMKSYSLFEINEHLRRVVALNFQDAFWVRCEIAQVSLSRGHYYIDLVEKDEIITAKARAILWARKFRKIKGEVGKVVNDVLQEGMEVLLKLRIEFNELYGMQYFVEEIDPNYTLGQLEMQRRQVILNLKAAGLLQKNESIPLPMVLQRIAVISSETAAGYQDYLKQLATNPFGYSFDNQLFVAAMQGAQVEEELIRQLKSIEFQKNEFDAVVIIRGGGARLDLLAFDNENICRTVANFPLPVLTGIGHDIDETVLDVVAHSALKTPTAVADFLINHNLFFENKLLQTGSELQNLIQLNLREQNFILQNAEQVTRLRSQSILDAASQMIQYIENEIPRSVRHFLKTNNSELNYLEEKFELLSPEATLKRGFSLTSIDGKIIRSKKEVKKGDEITTQLQDGEIKSKV